MCGCRPYEYQLSRLASTTTHRAPTTEKVSSREGTRGVLSPRNHLLKVSFILLRWSSGSVKAMSTTLARLISCTSDAHGSSKRNTRTSLETAALEAESTAARHTSCQTEKLSVSHRRSLDQCALIPSITPRA